jgi:hypothetical protein
MLICTSSVDYHDRIPIRTHPCNGSAEGNYQGNVGVKRSKEIEAIRHQETDPFQEPAEHLYLRGPSNPLPDSLLPQLIPAILAHTCCTYPLETQPAIHLTCPTSIHKMQRATTVLPATSHSQPIHIEDDHQGPPSAAPAPRAKRPRRPSTQAIVRTPRVPPTGKNIY